MAGWPSHFVAAGPATFDAPSTLAVDTINSADLADVTALTNAFVALIQTVEVAGSTSIIINSDVLDAATADKGAAIGTVAVKQALTAAVDTTASAIDLADINALTDDVQGWAQAYNLVVSSLAPQATFGWTVSIGDFAYNVHSGKRAVWNAASGATSDLLSTFGLYQADSLTKADFVAFTKSATTPALTDEQWHYALEYVKQVSDHLKTPALLSDIPTAQAATYFLGNTTGDRNIRKAAHSNVFALLFDSNTVN